MNSNLYVVTCHEELRFTIPKINVFDNDEIYSYDMLVCILRGINEVGFNGESDRLEYKFNCKPFSNVCRFDDSEFGYVQDYLEHYFPGKVQFELR